MSHAFGAVKFSDGLILHCEYNGTLDVLLSNLYNTSDEVKANWRKQVWKHHNDRSCYKTENVEIATTYGGGFSWKGRACRHCRVIIDNHSPNYDTRSNGLPDWYPKYKDEN